MEKADAESVRPTPILPLSFAPLHTRPLEIPADARKLADEKKFEVKGYRVGAAPEQSRPPRRVRIALVQNAIVRPTTDPIEEQVCVCLSVCLSQSAYTAVYLAAISSPVHISLRTRPSKKIEKDGLVNRLYTSEFY